MPEKFGTWLAIAAVAVGFVILVWLLFADSSEDKKKATKRISLPFFVVSLLLNF